MKLIRKIPWFQQEKIDGMKVMIKQNDEIIQLLKEINERCHSQD